MKRSIFNWYTYTGSYLDIRIAMGLFFLAIMFGMLGFVVIEGYSFQDALYMSIITISTVGFQEVKPLSEAGHIFTSILIIFNIGVYAYAITAFTSFVIHGGLFKKMHMAAIQRTIKHLKDHIILCGYGRHGKEIGAHFLHHGIDFVVIEKSTFEIEEIQKSQEKILYIHDDATQDEVLQQAGIEHARALISALPDDTDNVYTVLTARQLNPNLNIISRALHPRTQDKLKRAGANHTITPEQLGGFYMATLISKPGAVNFFSFITNEYETDIGFEELCYQDVPSGCRGKSIYDLEIRKKTGANIIGFKTSDGKYHVNPGPNTKLTENTSFIILGSEEQLNNLHKYVNSLTGTREWKRRNG